MNMMKFNTGLYCKIYLTLVHSDFFGVYGETFFFFIVFIVSNLYIVLKNSMGKILFNKL